MSNRPCRYGDGCYSSYCRFYHPRDGQVEIEKCWYGSNCTNASCTFYHEEKLPIIHCVKVTCDNTCGLHHSSSPCSNPMDCIDPYCPLNHGLHGNYRKLAFYSCIQSSCNCGSYHHVPLLEALDICDKGEYHLLTNFQNLLVQTYHFYFQEYIEFVEGVRIFENKQMMDNRSTTDELFIQEDPDGDDYNEKDIWYANDEDPFEDIDDDEDLFEDIGDDEYYN